MAAFEDQYVEVKIGLTTVDEEALAAMGKNPKAIAVAAGSAAVAFCEAQQSMLEGNDGQCGVGSLVRESLTKTEITLFCQKSDCFDQTICAKFAGRSILHEINSTTQLFQPFRTQSIEK